MHRILLADDHEIARSGLKLFINNFLPQSVIDEAWNGDSVIKCVDENKYDLIILDANMPATDCFELVSTLVNIQPGINILIFSMNEEIYAKKYLQVGAKGYINKTAPLNELRKAVHTVLHSKRYISNELSQSLAKDALAKNITGNPFDKLSVRELEVVQHLIQGHSSAFISKTLHIKPPTVATFKTRIFEKLNCKNVIEVSKLAKIYNIGP